MLGPRIAGHRYVTATETSLARIQALASWMPISGALSETAALSACRCEKSLLHRRRASRHRGGDRILPRSRHTERSDDCRGTRDILTGVDARRACSRLDRASSARPVPPVLEALATRGEGRDRRSLDGVAGVCLDMASIACSLVSGS